MNSLMNRFTWGLVVGRNYVWCSAIVSMFKRLGGEQIGEEERGFKS